MFREENPRSHTARITSRKIEKLGREKSHHTPYSSNLVPLDYHLFPNLQDHLKETAFQRRKMLKLMFVFSN